MAATTDSPALPGADFNWQKAVAAYTRPSMPRSLWQLATSLLPYVALWIAMYWSVQVSYPLTLALAVLAGGFLVRIFIIFHDCGHGSFFESQQLNHLVGSLCGIIVFTPYFEWRHAHAIHHATAGDLNRRGIGDVLTLTVDEYRALPGYKRLGYRLYRNPLMMFLLGPLLMFLIVHRIPSRNSRRRERNSVYWTNVALLAWIVPLMLIMGPGRFLLIMVPVAFVAGVGGVWMFYVQHQFENVYWASHGDWDYVKAALQGSSFYQLPRVLQWFTGNIGFHHIHHLSPRIPNYNLEACHKATPEFQAAATITLLPSLKTVRYKLWDEGQHKMVGFREATMRQPRPELAASGQ